MPTATHHLLDGELVEVLSLVIGEATLKDGASIGYKLIVGGTLNIGGTTAVTGTGTHIEKVLDGIKENTTRVWNTRAYLLAVLFNAPSTMDNHYTMLVNHDLNNGG